MAGNHTYLLLRIYGTKIGKFKQGALLPAANATIENQKQLLSDDDYGVVRTGACLTLTMLWLRQIVQGRTTFKYADGPSTGNADLIRVAAIGGRGHANLKQLAQTGGQSAHELRLYLAEKFGVPLSELRSVLGTTFAQALSAVVVLPQGQGALVSSRAFRTDGTTYIGRHATGFYRNGPNTIRFFDPNVGEYEVTDANNKRFFDEYADALKSLDQQFLETDLYMAKLT